MAVATTSRHRRSLPWPRLGSPPVTASTNAADVASALADRGRWRDADLAARRSVEEDPSGPSGWVTLAATFAGRGWFDQADQCLGEADRLGADPRAARVQVGRAVNRWALEHTPITLVALVGLLLGFGPLAVAAAVSVPFLVRERRIRRLPEPWRALAQQAWAGQGALRYPSAVIVLLLVGVWVLAWPFAG